MRSYRIGIIILIALILIAVFGCYDGKGGSKEGFHWGREYPRSNFAGPRWGYNRYNHWRRNPWQAYSGPPPPMWWWRQRGYDGYAAPLEQSLALQNYYNYLYGYPPSARFPYNE